MKNLYAKGYFLEPQLKQSMNDHVLGGECTLKGALSPNSGRRLLQLASFYVAEGTIECKDWKLPRIPLLYSWTCAICEGKFSYRCLENEIQIVESISGESYSDFPYENYPDGFSEMSVRLNPITGEEQNAIQEINMAPSNSDLSFDLSARFPNLSTPRHQVGGVPYYLAGEPADAQCPCCGKDMFFFAEIGNKSFSDPRGFMGNDFVQLIFTVCPDCNVVAVDNFSD